MGRPAKIIINLRALSHNLAQIKSIAPHSAVMAMVKSNAYGHGLTCIGRALNEADALGVACIEEGLMLRDAGVKNDIVLMEGLFNADELSEMEAGRFTIVVHHPLQVHMLEKTQLKSPIKVWLKVDTGMHRLGFAPKKAPDYYHRLLNCHHVKKPIGLMTHFASADAADPAITLKQIEVFNQVTQDWTGPRSLANSAGIIHWPHAHADWVRPGIMLYGASPFAAQEGKDHQLQPVMTLASELIAIHRVSKGERIGYGGTWTCPDDMLVGVVGIGYGDGYPRHARNGTPVLVNQTICPLIGRVSMDMLTVDLRTQPDAKVGDPVTLWGAGLPVEQVASHSDTSGYELLTRIAERVKKETIL